MRYKNSETRKIGRIFRGFHNFERYAAMLRIVLIRERFFVFRIKWMKKKKKKTVRAKPWPTVTNYKNYHGRAGPVE